ncbi:MAG: ABC transporter substrate-binding protein [Acidobacteria bacterium]|nr:ABC transporter substrate-binding protein [Acidobacteriota bacterium]
MAARAKGLIVLVALMACGASDATPSRTRDGDPGVTLARANPTWFAPRAQPRPATRIVSLVPALTEMLFAIGAGPQVAAVSSYDDFPPEAKALPRVGALLDPDVERILALRPDLVLTYGSQDALEAQLARAGIRTFSYRHGGLDALFQAMRDLGAVTGRTTEAARKANEIRQQLEAVRARVRGRPRPRVLLVFGREPQTLRQLYVSGGVGFLHEMLDLAGGANVFADIRRESVQPSSETLLTRMPEVILEIHETRMIAGADAVRERAAWRALSAIPAVRDGRIHFLNGDYLTVPGPRIGLATEAFARAIHPEAFR